jgi:murein DD-endopeptidase MepM/ murein hydrolase activator NlpD
VLRQPTTRALLCAALLILLVPVATASAMHAPDIAIRSPADLDPEPEPEPAEPEPFTLRVPAFGQLTSTFGPRWGRMHHGIDIGTLTKLGVVAAAPGKVTHTGYLPRFAGYGKVILIAHGEGRQTLYSHLSKIRVVPGDEVDAGAWIGNAGCTGWCTGTHLHFELRVKGIPVDPLPFFETAP